MRPARVNVDKCKCELKEFIDKDRFHDRFISNPSACKFECDKLCDVGEYLNMWIGNAERS